MELAIEALSDFAEKPNLLADCGTALSWINQKAGTVAQSRAFVISAVQKNMEFSLPEANFKSKKISNFQIGGWNS